MDESSRDEGPGRAPDTGESLSGGAGIVKGASDTEKDLFAQVVDATKVAMDGASDAYREAFEQVRDALPTFDDLLMQALSVPGTDVSRISYLAEVIGPKNAPSVVQAALMTTPAKAGIPTRKIARLAKASIGKDARRSTVLSFAAGIPGGAAAAATIPADMVQFYGHLIHCAQKLSYLYGWRDLVQVRGKQTDESSLQALIMLLGVAAAVPEADAVLADLAAQRRRGAHDDQLREALLTSACRERLARVSSALSAGVTRRLTGQVVGKAVPVIGGIASGFITGSDFGGMAKRLHKQLALHGA